MQGKQSILFKSIIIVQTVAIIYLLFQINFLSKHNENLIQEGEIDSIAPTFENFSSNQSLTNDHIRHLIKKTIIEELDNYFLKEKNNTPINDESKNQIQEENMLAVELYLENAISEGEISNNSIEKLYTKMTTLSDSDKKLALKKLARAINSGQLKMIH